MNDVEKMEQEILSKMEILKKSYAKKEAELKRVGSNDMQMYSAIKNLEEKIDGLIDIQETRDKQNKLMLWQAMCHHGESINDAKKNFFLNIPKAEGTLRNMQLAGKILLKKLDEVCKKNGIPYWLSFGTLLGAVRHKGFIPWDDDTDVCMMREDTEKLTKILKDDKDFYVSHIFAEFDDNLNHCVQLKFKEENTPYCLDIFVYDYCNDLSVEKIEHQRKLNADLARDAQSIRKSISDINKKTEKYQELFEVYLKKSNKDVGTTRNKAQYMIWALDNYRCRAFFQGNCAVTEVFPLSVVTFEGDKYFAPRNAEKYLREKYGDIYSLPNDMLSHTHFSLSEDQEKVLLELLEKYRKYL